MAKKTSGPTNEPRSQSDVIRELLGRGMTSPAEVVKTAQAEFGVKVTPNYVSILKNKKRGKGRKKRVIVKGTKTVRATVRTAPASSELSLENLALKFALKAGSVEAAISALQKLA